MLELLPLRRPLSFGYCGDCRGAAFQPWQGACHGCRCLGVKRAPKPMRDIWTFYAGFGGRDESIKPRMASRKCL